MSTVAATVVILAGGKSRRFGSDKALLQWQGKTLPERIAEECRPLFDEILVIDDVKGKIQIPGVRELQDIYPERGPLGGIYTGLAYACNEWVFAVACDMPFFRAEAAVRLLEFVCDCDAVVPKRKEELQPLFAAYRKSVLSVVEQMLLEKEYSVRNLFSKVRTQYVEGSLLMPFQQELAQDLFFNVNYPEDRQRLGECL